MTQRLGRSIPPRMERCAQLLIIRGRVQGVGYRWWARGEARRLGLSGWVRNRQDGAVEVLAAGAPAAVERLIQLCREGPTAATVTQIELGEASDDGVEGFEVRPTV